MKLSVLTATFNRGKMLERIYESIIRSYSYMKSTTCCEIEWIIIDDGSTDDTKRIANQIIMSGKNGETPLEIKYIYEQNSGKMQAINNGMKYVTGDVIVDCDSDDYFEENAFEIIRENVNLLFENEDIYALCFLKRGEDGLISGNEFKEDYQKSKMFDLYFKEGITGEKILVFNANIRKKFEHRLEKGENFVTEARMYHEMDKNYSLICINSTIEVGNYLEDGYTKNILNTFKQNPEGYYHYFKEILQHGLGGVKLEKKIYILKHFLWFAFLR